MMGKDETGNGDRVRGRARNACAADHSREHHTAQSQISCALRQYHAHARVTQRFGEMFIGRIGGESTLLDVSVQRPVPESMQGNAKVSAGAWGLARQEQGGLILAFPWSMNAGTR
jgi:hypothetical protein